MKIAFLVQLPKRVSPGQRFRIEQYEPWLIAAGYDLHTFSFFDTKTHKLLYRQGHSLQKFLGVLKGFLRRCIFLFRAKGYDFIFLQREASPLGPPIFEWFLAKILKKKLILDFDDAIWIKDSNSNHRLINFVRCFWKIKNICRWSYRIAVGNQFLADYALRYNQDVVIIPTCVETDFKYNRLKKQRAKETPVIGWTGSHSTLKYLDIIFPVLQELEREYDFEFLVICNEPPVFKLKSLRFLEWKEATEIDDLLKIDIGVMPLVKDAWSEGKCGFKLIQYLSLGIPAIASPVGVNEDIVEKGKSGFLCSTNQEWETAIKLLLYNTELREEMGLRGRQKIENEFSVRANVVKFLALFRE